MIKQDGIGWKIFQISSKTSPQFCELRRKKCKDHMLSPGDCAANAITHRRRVLQSVKKLHFTKFFQSYIKLQDYIHE